MIHAMTIEELEEKIRQIGLSWDDRKKNRFQKYAILLKQWNQKMNLTAVDDESEVYEKHFLDCVLPMKHHFPGNKVCDVGSGAGFPGLVFAIMDPSLEITLVEPTRKRCRFLEEAASQLALDHITVVNSRAEDLAEKDREMYDVVTARAVAALPVLSELCIPLVRKGGLFLAMKGDRGQEEAAEAEFAVRTLGCVLENAETDELPESGKRTNLYYKKVKNTPPQYPRPYARIKKNPLKGKQS